MTQTHHTISKSPVPVPVYEHYIQNVITIQSFIVGTWMLCCARQEDYILVLSIEKDMKMKKRSKSVQ